MAGPSVDDIVQEFSLGFELLPGVKAYPIQEFICLIFTAP